MTKAETLNFNFRYLSSKKPSCKCVRYNKHGIKNCKKFEYTEFVTATASRSQYFVIINYH